MAGEDLFDTHSSAGGSKKGTGEYYGGQRDGEGSGDPYQWGQQGRQRQQVGYDEYGQPIMQWQPGSSGAEIERQRYQNLGNEAGARQAPTIDYDIAHGRGRQADLDRLAAYQARGAQADALGMHRSAALGLQPSVAQIQLQQGLDSSIRSQQALAASARGPAGVALAQQQAAGNAAALQQQASAESAKLRADEMARARDAYFGGASAIRGQDLGAQGLSYEGQRIGAQMGQAQAGLQMQQNALNQQGQLAWEGMAYDVERSRMDAAFRQAALNQGAYEFAWKEGEANRDRTERQTGRILDAVGTGISYGVGNPNSDIRAKENVQPMGRQPMGGQPMGGAPYAPRMQGPAWGQAGPVGPQGGMQPQQPMMQTRSLMRGPSGPMGAPMQGQAPAWGGAAMPGPQRMATPAALGNAVPTGPAMGGSRFANASNVDLGASRMNARTAWMQRPMMLSDKNAKKAAELQGFARGMRLGMHGQYNSTSPVQTLAARDRVEPAPGGGIVRSNPYGPEPAPSPLTAARRPVPGEPQYNIIRENPFEPTRETWMDTRLVRQNPYEEPIALSDDRAKLNAARLEGLRDGAQAVLSQQQGPAIPGIGHATRALDAELPNDEEAKSRAARATGRTMGGQKDGELNYSARTFAQPNQTTQAFAAMAPSSYQYKPGLGTPGTHVGPMAQTMASNPVTGTAVTRDPRTGLLALDQEKSLKLAMGGVGHLAAQQQKQQAEIEKLKATLGQSPKWGGKK